LIDHLEEREQRDEAAGDGEQGPAVRHGPEPTAFTHAA
jgi:hypothetical protein